MLLGYERSAEGYVDQLRRYRKLPWRGGMLDRGGTEEIERGGGVKVDCSDYDSKLICCQWRSQCKYVTRKLGLLPGLKVDQNLK